MQEYNYPTFIYKYCDLKNDSESNKINSLENLKNEQIWFSNPNRFNDPFDCSVALNGDDIINEIVVNNIDIIKSNIDSLKKDGIDLSLKQSEILCSKRPLDKFLFYLEKESDKETATMIKTMFYSSFPDAISDFNEKYKSKLKVSCFSELYDSLLMWGHYADKHQGFCMKYNLNYFKENHFFKTNLFKINYTNELLDMTQYYIDNAIKNLSINKEKLIESILYKFTEWEYEKEWRVITTKNEYQQDFFNAAPQAIYLGAKINKDNETIIRDIALSKDIPVYKMKLDTHKYKLNYNG